jgi:hypothetical protein
VALRGAAVSRLVTRSCAANVQRARALFQQRSQGSRDALSFVGAIRHGRRCEPERRLRRGATSLKRLKDCRT